MSKIHDSEIPVLTFCPRDLPQPATPHGLSETARELHRLGGWVACYDARAGRAMELAAAALLLVSVFSFGTSSFAAHTRRELRTMRHARRAMVGWAQRYPRLVLLSCALLFGACGSVNVPGELEPDTCDVDGDAPTSGEAGARAAAAAAELERERAAAPDIRDALADAIDAWEAMGHPIDGNCPALYLVSVRAVDDAQFFSGRFCSLAQGAGARACFRPLEGELVFAPGDVDDLDGLVRRAVFDGLARCEASR
jgi:hypothetical protein